LARRAELGRGILAGIPVDRRGCWPIGGGFRPTSTDLSPCVCHLHGYLVRPFRTPKPTMSRVCAVSGRRTRVGNKVKRRGLAKKDGGGGRRVTGRSKRKVKPNLQPVRILTPEGSVMTLKLCTKVIKRGVITLQKGDKTVSFPLVKAVRGRNRAFTKAQKA